MRAAALMVAIIAFAPADASAREQGALSAFVFGTACAALNLAYGPVKVAWAVVGTATGAAAWTLTGGNGRVARAIIQPAVRGDYMIVPAHLRSEEPLEFYGRDPERSPYW